MTTKTEQVKRAQVDAFCEMIDTVYSPESVLRERLTKALVKKLSLDELDALVSLAAGQRKTVKEKVSVDGAFLKQGEKVSIGEKLHGLTIEYRQPGVLKGWGDPRYITIRGTDTIRVLPHSSNVIGVRLDVPDAGV